MSEQKRYFIETKLGRNFLRDAMTPGIIIRPDEAVARLNSQVDTIATLTAERDALEKRVAALEAGLYPFQHPDFTKIRRPDRHPMFGYDNASLIYGDFARARQLFTDQRPVAEPTPASSIPELSEYAKSQIAKAEPPSGLQGKQ